MSNVYFTSRVTGPGKGLIEKLKKLIQKTGFAKVLDKNDIVALKTHFGALGLTTYLRPIFIRPFAEVIKKAGAYPFLTDANTLYKGSRANGVQHLETAIRNGFGYSTTGAPIIIADGINSEDYVEAETGGSILKKAYVAGETQRANSMVVLSHFKGHDMFGFAGAVKNIGMGLASKKGKLLLHSTTKPFIKEKACRKCGICIKWCPSDAIAVKRESMFVDETVCTGCGQCVMVCPYKAAKIKWDIDYIECQKKTAEYARAVLLPKKDRIWFFNFLIDITPDCDCVSFSDIPIVSDIGILASDDPVAVDQASYDMVTQARALPGGRAAGAAPGEDKFARVHEDICPEPMLEHSEKIGLGSRDYKLIKIGA
jgi:uncharacterized Fe-S center protein